MMTKSNLWKVLLGASGLVFLAAATAAGADWPYWRGPNHAWHTKEVPAKLPESPKLLWQQPLPGDAYAGVVVANGIVVTASYDEAAQADVILAFKAATGAPAWKHTYPNTLEEMDYGPAPRATPVIHDGRVYTLGCAGAVRCLDLEKGTVVWKADLVADFRADVPEWGFCSTPIIVDGKLILNPGGGTGAIVALDAKTGKPVWHGKGWGYNYASLIAGTFGGVPQVIGYTAGELKGWAAKDGTVLWSMMAEAMNGYICPSPAAYGDQLLLTDEEGTRLFKFGAGGKMMTDPVAENADFTMECNTPVVVKEIVLGAAGGNGLMALDAKLEELWVSEDADGFFGFSTILVGDDGRVLLFDEMGKLHLVSVGRDGAKVLGSVKLSKGTMAAPALADGRFFCHDAKTLYAYELGPVPKTDPKAKAGGAAKTAAEAAKAALEKAEEAVEKAVEEAEDALESDE